ncbi:hypothetical protein ANANG_G00106420 [Anguilla anguilla]|uniref:Peptidase S8/S53 domain-containing protein n=1 Tax=Anguilla anguilla TaxID=7936 RepID=A0A9D3MMP9_ANGAN|nr:hypothetical protein ANANG_G00106420 [Anguilla anguilla]
MARCVGRDGKGSQIEKPSVKKAAEEEGAARTEGFRADWQNLPLRELALTLPRRALSPTSPKSPAPVSCSVGTAAGLVSEAPRGHVFGDYYHFRHRAVVKRSTSGHRGTHVRLHQEPQVLWAEQQLVKRRKKRDIYAEPSDPKFAQQWYLFNPSRRDLNAKEAWEQGYTGRGVVVSILDDGIEKNHPDLADNYDPKASYDVNDGDTDPQPRYTQLNDNRHGTRCAGEVAAVANNGICGVGVAYNAKIGGVRMLDGEVTDVVEAQSLSLNPQHIDIYSASWGPEDDGKTVDGPAKLAKEAFLRGVTEGRGGLGSIFVWASGNGGREKDSCNCDGYTNSIYTLSISSSTQYGNVPWYSEACSSTLATTYSSGSLNEKQIVTTDLRQKCTDSHTGTSASAPLAAGIIAPPWRPIRT